MGNVGTANITDLSPLTTYTFTLIGNNDGGDSIPSDAVTVTTLSPPVTPTGLVLKFNSESMI